MIAWNSSETGIRNRRTNAMTGTSIMTMSSSSARTWGIAWFIAACGHASPVVTRSPDAEEAQSSGSLKERKTAESLPPVTCMISQDAGRCYGRPIQKGERGRVISESGIIAEFEVVRAVPTANRCERPDGSAIVVRSTDGLWRNDRAYWAMIGLEDIPALAAMDVTDQDSADFGLGKTVQLWAAFEESEGHVIVVASTPCGRYKDRNPTYVCVEYYRGVPPALALVSSEKMEYCPE